MILYSVVCSACERQPPRSSVGVWEVVHIRVWEVTQVYHFTQARTVCLFNHLSNVCQTSTLPKMSYGGDWVRELMKINCKSVVLGSVDTARCSSPRLLLSDTAWERSWLPLLPPPEEKHSCGRVEERESPKGEASICYFFSQFTRFFLAVTGTALRIYIFRLKNWEYTQLLNRCF
jgi:hypothetical protein